nr:uncharacterized protein LOC105326615 isoform X2 [Crassostrea gigas]
MPPGISIRAVDNKKIVSDSPNMALQEVQRGFLFLLESLHQEEQLICFIRCKCRLPPLCDDERIEIRDGKGYFKKKELLKCLISKGELTCSEFLEMFRSYQNLYSQFCIAKQSVIQADGLLQDIALTNDRLVDYAELLLEEMEPGSMSDILFCYGVLNSAEHLEINSNKLKRRRSAKILLDKTREQPDKMPVFCHALVKTRCSRAIEYIRNGVNESLPPFRRDSVRCVTFNFRKLIKNLGDCQFRREFLFQYMRRRGYIDNNTEPKECVLIKAGIRGKKPGCDCIWELTRQQDLALLERMFGLLDERKAHPRSKINLSLGIEVLSEKKDFFLEQLEPTHISHILLEEEAFSVDDHDAVNNKTNRREKIEALLDILKNDGSELTFETFIFALRNNIFIMNNLQPGAEIQTADHGSTENEIQVREVGPPQRSEDTETAAELDVIVSIPVEGDEERIRRAVEQLQIDSNFKVEVAQVSHLMVESVDMGSVVLRLVAMTDYASERLLAENGENMKKLVETFLKFSDLKEDMIKGNIKVTVLVPEEEIGSDDQTMASDKEIKVKENWNMLVEELEPSILAKKLLEKGVLNDSDVTAINSEITRKGKVECLLNMLPSVKGIDAYAALFESLHELGKTDIVDQIKPSENMHQEAEKVRYGLLSRLKEVIDEIESEFIEETFKQCGFLENPMDKVKSYMSKSRKERALNFLMSILVNDAYVLAFKNVLDSYKLNPLYKLKMPIDESIFSRSPRTTRKRSKGEKLFECEYKVIRKGKEVEDAHMDWESSYSDMERQTDVPKPKYYEPKKILDPKPRPVRQAQVAVPKENEEEWPVVVALDFGTTYSGYAFWRKENPSEITTGKWNTGSKEVLESLKTPTSLLLNQNNEVIEFGYKAEKIFKELAEDEDDKGYRYFRQFKMTLHNESLFDEKRPIPDHLKRPLEALEVFSLSIRDLRDECFRDFDNKRIKVDPDDILWILTVPAIWGDSAKQFMRKAAEKAGIPSDQLKLALEPEAAAIYVMKEAKTVFGKGTVTTFNPGTKIMVADLGGGTADLTVLEVKEDRKMKQLHQSAGGAWGGNLINKKIWEIMEEIFGSDVIEDFKKQTSDFMEMESIIELKKRDITIGSKLELPIFPSLSGLCKQDYRTLIKNSKYGNSVKARTGKLRFEPDMVQKIFDLTFTNLFTVVEKVLKHENAVGVNDIILVGGFAQADIIVKQFEEKFSGYKVIVPIDPVLAVLKGAVMFGQDIDIISSRITAHTYGFDAMRHFRDGDLRSKKRKIDNTIYCVDLFEKMVAIGESVDVGKTFEKEVFASSKEMKSMVLKFYQSEIKNPTYVTDYGCECIGKLSVEMPDLSGGTERSVMVSIKFGETEITVCGVDKTTGKKQETVLDLLRDTK